MTESCLRIHDATLTHPGRVRSHNEDHILGRLEEGLWVVADGMGGHANGAWASGAITEALEKAELPEEFEGAVDAVAGAIHDANQRIWAESFAQGQSMGSTVVALLVRGNRFAVIWAGDSRCYLLRGGALYQLTMDHSTVQDMLNAGRLTPEEAVNHPMGHVLSRAVGVKDELELDVVADEALPGDVFLVCSDGLTRTIEDAELASLLVGGQPETTAERLVALCLERGAPDNVSVAVVTCDEITLLALAET